MSVYQTEDYDASRLTPDHELNIPLTKLDFGKKIPIPSISSNHLYAIEARKRVNCLDVNSLDYITVNDGLSPIKGITDTEFGLFTMQDDNRAYLLDKATLHVTHELPNFIEYSTKTVSTSKGLLVIKRNDDRRYWIALLDANRVKWEVPIFHVISSFAVSNSKVTVTDTKGGILCVNLVDGEVIWNKTLNSIGVLTESEISSLGRYSLTDNPHIFRNKIVMRYISDYLIGVCLDSGNVDWKVKINSSMNYTSVSNDGVLYSFKKGRAEEESEIIIIDSSNGEITRKVSIMSDKSTKSKIVGTIYSDVTSTHFWGLTKDGFLYAINLTNATLDWSYDLGSIPGRNPFFICSNRLFVQTVSEFFIFEGVGGHMNEKHEIH